jgi:multidrug efflux pump subunit AcrA (membrane-fusion protein)
VSKKALWVIILLAGVGAAAVGFYWPFGSAEGLRFSGIVEIQEVRLGSKVGGRVAKLLVQEGDKVKPGQELVIFEAPELENLKEQLKSRLDMAEAELEKTINGPRPEEIKAARAAADAARSRYDRLAEGWRIEEKQQAASELETAQAEYKQAQADYLRLVESYRNKSVSRLEYDAAVGAHDRAKGRFNAAKAKNDMLQAGTRKQEVAEAKADWDRLEARYDELYRGYRDEDKALARAKVAEARAKVRENDINLRETTVKVPPELGMALVEVVAVRPGDLVPPNQPVVRVLRAEDLWVKIFVPETKLGIFTENQGVEVKVKNMPVQVTIDAYPHQKFQGIVSQVANVSEFTPRNVQSIDERRHQVFAVKIRIPDPQGHFHAGMAAEVFLPARN